ncbi:glutaminase [Denitromonas halophila]|uniref:Glutaminase n=1 Tax=Denitromonas halophila TaxID=1629404 RepID=A0A557R2Q8_9RHOO|nr:glutaminase [Denitromonas halophila]TVO59443.1 glutaminase [Denitromonas halophila]
MDYQSVLDAIVDEVEPLVGEGKVADYIPALARVPVERFGIALYTVDGEVALAGDALEAFSIQSVSKVFSLTLALKKVGEQLWLRLGREPSGDPFNSLMQLEVEQGKARNPFINAGAICVADQLMSLSDDPKAELLDLVSTLCGESVAFDPEVAESERATGFRNAALANFMKSFGKIDNDVDRVLDVYFNQCSIAMNCVQMARAMAYLANAGVQPVGGREIVTPRQARRINALMLTCGTYDAAGEFAFLIGLPCKSGVGGGIVAVVPGELALCVWSPGLGSTGNSVVGMRALELFVAKTGLSVF